MHHRYYIMKEAKQTVRKKRKEPLYSVMDGWNFGIGFWLAFVATTLIIVPVITLILWIIFILFGAALGALL